MFRAALHAPRTTALVLLGGSIIAVASSLIGRKAFDESWSAAPWLAWPSGIMPFVIPGLALWLLLLVPPGPLENIWTRRIAVTLLAGVAVGAIVQLLDDHVLGHAGTDNPLGFSLPLQDYLTMIPLIMIAIALFGTLSVTALRLWVRLRNR